MYEHAVATTYRSRVFALIGVWIMNKQIELTLYDKEYLARLGRQAQAIQRVTA